MTRKTIGFARYGLVFENGETTVLYAVALIQALGACSKRPIRVFVFERESASVLDEATLAKCWEKSLNN